MRGLRSVVVEGEEADEAVELYELKGPENLLRGRSKCTKARFLNCPYLLH